MTAPTTAVRFLLARAAVRTTGVLHVVSQRDSGLLMPVCGANPIRSAQIDQHDVRPADVPVCGDCEAITARLGGIDAILGSSARSTLTHVSLAAVSSASGRTADEALIDSVRQHGVLQPILVTATDSGYSLIAGARRLHAAAEAGLTMIPAIVVNADPSQAAILALVENLHRQDLNPIELAHAYSKALEHCESKAELGRRLGVSREQVSNTIRLLALPVDAQAAIAAGDMTAQDGRALLARQQIARRPASAPLPDVAAALAQALDARVHVTATVKRTRITIDTDDADLPRLLAALGLTLEDAA